MTIIPSKAVPEEMDVLKELEKLKDTMSYDSLAEYLGMEKRTLYRWLTGESQMTQSSKELLEYKLKERGEHEDS